MNNLDEIKNLIETKLAGSSVQVGDLTGTQDHLEIFVVSDEFKGKMLLDQHQIVMDILKDSLKEKIHAVKIKTMTKEKFNQQG
ncbi:MAG: BolA family transcriptional regulator [Halobacteriovoraceae bacterium]|jgi:stress-induced morphogen|nr:BolA family transcriptional regulator [Halobacteriovoraceae bacterium]